MPSAQANLTVSTSGQGLYLITNQVTESLRQMPEASGILHVFLQHTSASLLLQENADPTARKDLEDFLTRLAPENQSWHRHLAEGPDDTVSHLRAAITPNSLTLPVSQGKLAIGTWQGIYVWEHRKAPHERKLVLTLVY